MRLQVGTNMASACATTDRKRQALGEGAFRQGSLGLSLASGPATAIYLGARAKLRAEIPRGVVYRTEAHQDCGRAQEVEEGMRLRIAQEGTK